MRALSPDSPLPSASRPGRGTWLAGLAFQASLLGAQGDELARLEAMRVRNPRDAVVLYNLAALQAAAGRRAETLELLEAVSRAPGGLDPGFYRGFYSLRGDLAYEALLGRIRSANPPKVRGRRAFTLLERDLQPEGIAFDPVTRSAFVGSFKGKIVRVDARGAVSDFALASTAEARRVVVGLRVDPARGRLWAVVDDPRAFGDPALPGAAALHCYGIRSGRLLSRHAGATRGAFNDVAVAGDGRAYATNTSDGSVWRTEPGSTAMREFLPAGTVPEANGLTFSADGRHLFIAGWHDIVRVDLRTRAVLPLQATEEVPTGSFDGLLWYRGGLVGIQNGIHPGRIVRFRLDPARTRILRAEILERYHPDYNGVTTAALDGSSLLYFANTQSRAFGPDGSPLPGAVLRDILILRLPLDGRGPAPGPQRR